jgi:ATP/maltotriose-dependent transcriptional regulator MalT
MGETGSPEVNEIQAYLPEEPNSFVGRERELGELRHLLGQTRALTLCGPGGVGKTRLALRVLAAVADEFPDGVWFVELATSGLRAASAMRPSPGCGRTDWL